MKRFIFLLLAIPSFAVQAQTIKGVVFSVQEKAPVEFSPVTLLHLPDSSLSSGLSTKAGGVYVFENVKPGNYYIKATYLGCKPNGKVVEVTAGTKDIQVDTIYLSPASKQLGEVKVTGERITGKELVDRTVYSIPPEIAKTSVNGYEILRKIPGIQVDFNNNITLNGKSNFIIQVDGKQRDKEYLARLLPSDIQSIEVINNPSGKYEGTIDGVINIILKKEARIGMNGNFSGMIRAAKKPTGYGAGSLEYGFGKISIYASGYSFFQSLNNTSVNYTRIPNDTTDLKGNGSFKIGASAINTGFDYYINAKNNLSFNFSYKPLSLKNDGNSEGPINALISKFLSSPSNTSTKSDEINASLFYKKTYAKPIQEFSSEAIWYNFNSTDDNHFSYLYYPLDRSRLDSSRNTFDYNVNKRNSFSEKVDYVYPVGISARIEAGYQFYYQQMNYEFKNRNLFQNVVESGTGDTTTYKYSELRNAAYGGIIWNVNKFGFQTSLRVENSDVLINKDKSSNYTAWLPSANIQYKITGMQNVKITYNRRINRPSVYDLNPNIKLANNLSYTQGNPYLVPEYRDRLQFTYSLNFGKNFLSPSIYYEFLSNKIGQRNQLTGDAKILTTPDNILTGYERGIGLNANILFFNVNGRIYQGHYNEYRDLNTIRPAQDYSSFSVTSYAFAPLFNKKLNAFVFLSYNGVSVNAQSKTYSTPMYGFGAQWITGNHTIGAFYFLPFKKEFIPNKTKTETTYFYSETSTSFDVSYYIQVMYSYKFNKGKAVKKVNHKAETESDTKSEGIR